MSEYCAVIYLIYQQFFYTQMKGKVRLLQGAAIYFIYQQYLFHTEGRCCQSMAWCCHLQSQHRQCILPGTEDLKMVKINLNSNRKRWIFWAFFKAKGPSTNRQCWLACHYVGYQKDSKKHNLTSCDIRCHKVTSDNGKCYSLWMAERISLKIRSNLMTSNDI